MSIDDLILAAERAIRDARVKQLQADIETDILKMFGSAMKTPHTDVFIGLLAESISDTLAAWTIPADLTFRLVAPTNTKVRTCPECYAVVGHYSTCLSKGYGSVGPHPQSPDAAAEPETERTPGKCECGVTKTGVGGLHSSWCPAGGAL